jgi:peptide/nickel transport system substrate-binding protein
MDDPHVNARPPGADRLGRLRPEGLDRRRFLQVAGAGAVATLASGLVVACRGASTASVDSGLGPGAAGTPKRGGTLRLGLSGGGTDDTCDPVLALTLPSYVAVNLAYDALTVESGNGPASQLATSFESNADATLWTVRIRDGVEFHNGKTMTAEDVIYSFRRVLDPKLVNVYTGVLSRVDVKNMKMLDKLTIQIPCTSPYSILPSAITAQGFLGIVPVGYDSKKPIGSGPYMVSSFTPGSQMILKRNPNYWLTDEAYLDEIVVTNFPDTTSETNAFLGGQIDVAANLTAATLATVQAAGQQVAFGKTAGWVPIVMRTDRAPFNDVNVRTAMKLLVDRNQMVETIWSGHAEIANDLFGRGDPDYDSAIPQRPYDPDQAKSLLKKAGAEGLTATFTASAMTGGATDLATVFAQQAQAVGVTININTVDPGSFFGPGFLSYPLTEDYWGGPFVLATTLQATAPGATSNETHFHNAQYGTLIAEALKETDAAKRKELTHQIQQIDYDQGGYIIPWFTPTLDGYSSRVHGIVVEPHSTGLPLNAFRALKKTWLD